MKRSDQEINTAETKLIHLKKLFENNQIDSNYLRKQEVENNHSIISLERIYKEEIEKTLQENNSLLNQNIQKEKINMQSEELLKKGREDVQKM